MSGICDDLRKSILRAAITGRLTVQLASDAPVKKELDANNISHDDEKEYPFDIPENWAWVKLKAVTNVQYGFPFNSQLFNKNEKGMPLIRIRDILPAKTSTYTTEKAPENYLIKKNDMLVGMDGNFNVNFWSSDDAYLNQRCCKITAGEYLEQKLLYWFLPVFLDEVFENVSYTTVKHLSDKHLTKMSIPLPPLTEQERIVKKVDELMARVADLEQSADALASLKKAFPDDIKASLLQAAMQGKLTEQLPEDGNTEELLDQIKAEKERLIAEGKIKKQKPLAPITDDEIPFSIPENWKWVRLNDIVVKEIRRGKPPVYDKNGSSFAFAQKCNTKYTGIDLSLAKAISNNSLKKYSEDDAIATSDIIVNSTGTGTLGRVGFIDPKIPMNTNYYPDSHVTIVRVPKFISNYVYVILKNSEKYFEEKGEGSTNQKELKPLTIQNLIIPLPPIAEQKRIVERLNAILQNVNAVGDLIASE